MTRQQRRYEKQHASSEQEHRAVLNTILADGLLAQYSVVDEVKLLLLFTQRHVCALSTTYNCHTDIELAQGYIRGSVSARQLISRKQQAMKTVETLDEQEQAIQELTLLFLNPCFLDGTEQNEDTGSFLYLLSKVQAGLCEQFYEFLTTQPQPETCQ